MRAVNLIPHEQRRGAGGVAGRSGGVMYVLVGALVVIVALGIVYALAVRSVADRKGQLASVTAQVGQVQGEADALEPYVAVAQLRQRVTAAAASLAQSRFDWPGAMRQIALALPSDVTLTSLEGTVPSSAGSSTAQPATSTGPAFALAGCASSQAEVATVLTQLSEVPGVTGASLSSASKSTDSVPNARKPVGPNGAEAGNGGCRFVTFNLTFTYDSSYTISGPKSASAAADPSAASATSGAGTPASTTSAAGSSS